MYKIEVEKKYFSYRLYRQNATISNFQYVKDLSIIGRDLSRTIIVDNLSQNFILQRENGILIKTFHKYHMKDKSLHELKKILLEIAKSQTDDLRKSLLNYKDLIRKNVS